MVGTKKLMVTLSDPEFEKLSDVEICNLYQHKLKKDPRLLATLWLRHYNLIFLKHSNPMFCNIIGENDLASWSLECLDTCMLSYVEGSCKFTTYFATVLHNRLRTEWQQLNCDKRSVSLHSISLDATISETGDETSDTSNLNIQGLLQDPYNHYEDAEFRVFLEQARLTPKQRFLCNCKIHNYENIDVAKYMGVSSATINQIRKGAKNTLQRYYSSIFPIKV